MNKTYQFARYIDNSLTEIDSYGTFEKDGNGRKIKTSRATERDNYNHYVCHENFVIPRYVIEFYSEVSLRFDL